MRREREAPAFGRLQLSAGTSFDQYVSQSRPFGSGDGVEPHASIPWSIAGA
jgi:hypothetical protein